MGVSKRSTTFYFTEIPDSYREKEMYKTFMAYIEIDEVVIPSKRDNRGRRYLQLSWIIYSQVVEKSLLTYQDFKEENTERVSRETSEELKPSAYKHRSTTSKYNLATNGTTKQYNKTQKELIWQKSEKGNKANMTNAHVMKNNVYH